MAHREHRLGVSETTLVNRHLKLDSSDLDAVKAAVADIDELYGLICFDLSRLARTLHVAPPDGRHLGPGQNRADCDGGSC